MSTSSSYVSTRCPHSKLGQPLIARSGITIALVYGMKLLPIVAALMLAAPVYAQKSVRPPQGWSLSLSGGGAAFTDFQRSTVRALGPTASGGLEHRDFPLRISAKTTGTFAAGLSYWSNSAWGLRLFGSYAATRFKTLIAESDAAFLNVPQSSEEAEELAPLTIASADAQAMVRFPIIRNRITPYAFLGGGIVRYGASPTDGSMPEEADADFASGSQIKPAARLGVGASLPLGRDRWRLNFELNDQIAPTPLRRGGDRSVNITNAVAFMIGVSYEF